MIIFEHGSSAVFASGQHGGLSEIDNSAGQTGKQTTNTGNLWSGCFVKDKTTEEMSKEYSTIMLKMTTEKQLCNTQHVFRRIFGFINWVDDVNWIRKLMFGVLALRQICSDEGLTLKTSVYKPLYGGQFTSSTQLIKPNYLVILCTNTAPQFLQKLIPFIYF